MFRPHTAKLLRVALGTGVDARPSRDAGSYLCNYLSWRAIEATDSDNGPALTAFVHIPPLARDGAARRKDTARRITLNELVDAGEAMLLEMVRLTRQTVTRFVELQSAKLRTSDPEQLTLLPTIILFHLPLSPAPPHFCVTPPSRAR